MLKNEEICLTNASLSIGSHFTILKLVCRALETILVTSLVACANHSGQTPAADAPVTTIQGGDGSGGGNTTVTRPEAVRSKLAKLKPRLLTILNRVHAWDHDGTNELIINKNVEDFFANSSLAQVIKTMNIDVQDEPCNPAGSPDKAGYGYPKTNTICMSVSELSKLPEASFSLEIDALGFHEVGHLVGLDEMNCQMIQQWLVNRPWVTDLTNTKIGPMIEAYDSTIDQIAKVIDFAASGRRIDLCRAVSSYETRISVLDQTLDVPPGSIWRNQLVPKNLMVNIADPAMLPVLNWGNDVCIDEAFKTADRVKHLKNAIGVANYLITKRVSLALYQSQDNVYANFPSLVGMDSITAAPVLLKVLSQGLPIKDKVLVAKGVDCKLTDLISGSDIALSSDTATNQVGVLVGTIVDQSGKERALKIKLWSSGLAILQTDFNDTDIHVLNAPTNARVASYFQTIFGIYQPFAAVDGYRNFEIDFFIIEPHSAIDVKPTGKTYRLNCQSK